jgi:hypothetical protein
MSKRILSYYTVFATIWLILQIFTNAAAQEVLATVHMRAADKRVWVEGRFLEAAKGEPERRNLSFLDSIAGISGLGERIEKLTLTDAAGNDVEHRKLQTGEYLADRGFTAWSYEVDLTPRTENAAAAHVSWLGDDHGLLMLADILPLGGTGERQGKFRLELPAGWSSTIRKDEAGDEQFYEALRIDDVVVLIGRELKSSDGGDGSEQDPLRAYTTGRWHFTNAEVSGYARQIAEEYARKFGRRPAADISINVLPFPRQEPYGTWVAETRGNTVTIVSADMAFRTQSLQRLHEQLRHELFHLWIPNGLSLTGNYDWYYEGFALYQSLKTGVAVNRISFGDMLSTLSRALAIDKRQSNRRSLIESSGGRWRGSNTEVYARGMLIAFLTDIAMLDSSRGKASIENLLAETYGRHSKPAQPADGNNAVMAILEGRPELRPIVERFVKGSEAIDIEKWLQPAGIRLAAVDNSELMTVEKPRGRQKTILDKLGYNNWRKAPKYKK